MIKSKAALRKELEAAEIEVTSLKEELALINGKMLQDLSAMHQELKDSAIAGEQLRQEQLQQLQTAMSAFNTVFERANEFKNNLLIIDRTLIGVPAIAALDAQLQLLEQLFGDL